jgi:hypothetical protein
MDDLEETKPLVLNEGGDQPRLENQMEEESKEPRGSIHSLTSRSSIMSASVLYDQHLTQHAHERRVAQLASLSQNITIYGVLFILSAFTASIALGAFVSRDSMIASNGCELGLPYWYCGTACLIGVKLAIESIRYFIFRRNNEENPAVQVGGNYILMPILFLIYFAFT